MIDIHTDFFLSKVHNVGFQLFQERKGFWPVCLKEEESIDINAVSEELKSQDDDIKDTAREIEVYCKELGIDTTF